MLLSLLQSFFRNARALADDGAVNLADLGMDGFTPYVMERNQAWIALPVVTLAVLILHLKRARKKTLSRRE